LGSLAFFLGVFSVAILASHGLALGHVHQKQSPKMPAKTEVMAWVSVMSPKKLTQNLEKPPAKTCQIYPIWADFAGITIPLGPWFPSPPEQKLSPKMPVEHRALA
jgi:hypothetical protein